MTEAKKDESELTPLLAGSTEIGKVLDDMIIFGSGACVLNVDVAKHIPLKSLYKDKQDDI
jgi:hypothetical protein